VWPQWLQAELGVRANVAAWVHRSISGGAVSRRIQNTASILLGSVCAECNNGWMSELESRAAPVIRKLLAAPAEATLAIDEASALALWAFKTAIVLNASSNYRRIVPDDHFRFLYMQQAIPPLVVVDSARFETNRRLTSLQSQHFIGVVEGDSNQALDQIRNSSYNIVLAVGCLGLRVVHFPLRGHHLVSDFEQKKRTRRLWPVSEPVAFDVNAPFGELMDFEMSLAFGPEARSR